MQSLPELYWLIPAAAGVYFLGVPLLILATFRQSASPELTYVDDDVGLPEEVFDHFEHVEQSLEELGFNSGDLMYLPGQMDNVRAILQLFTNQQNRTSAMGVSMFSLSNGRWKLASQYVEFCTKSADGFEVDSTNTRDVGALPGNASKVVNWLPRFTDLTQLYAAHCVMADAQIPFESRVLNLHRAFGGDEAAYVADSMLQELDDGTRSGYLKLSADGTEYVATVPGAYKMTWKQLPPIKGLYARWLERQSLSRLEQAGWDATLAAG